MFHHLKLIVLGLAFVAIPCAPADAALIAYYVDGTDADAAALVELANSPLVNASNLSAVGFEGAPLITRTEFNFATPAGPTAGSGTSSEWLSMRASTVGTPPVTTTDYFGFTVTAEDRLFLTDLTFDHVAAVNNDSGGIISSYSVFAQINGGGFSSVGTGSLSTLVTAGFSPVITQVADLSSIVLAAGDTLELRIAFADNSGSNAKASFVQGIQLEGFAIPEPASLTLLGLVAVGLLRRRRCSL